MRLSVSTIGWLPAEDVAVAPLLRASGVAGVEVAPTRAWEDLAAVSAADVTRHRNFWSTHGLEVSAMQALLYGRPDLALFGDEATRNHLVDYLAHVIRIGGGLGAGVLVFGAPGQRRRNGLALPTAEEIALAVFLRLGELAVREGTTIGLEANPPEYGCDFLTTNGEVADFVRHLAHPGVVHHFDLGGTILSGEAPADAVARAWPIEHFHASAPYLGPLDPVAAELTSAVTALAARGYDRWISIEMRRQEAEPVEAVLDAVRLARAAVTF